MSRVAYFDCFSGVSGDMLLGALVDAGLAVAELEADLGRLGLPGWSLQVSRVNKLGITGTKVTVLAEEQHHHRHLADIERIVSGSGLPEPVQAVALQAFRRLAEAEAKIHGTTPDKIHFHEVGAIDSIVDTVGVAIGLHRLGISAVYVSPLNTGRGMVRMAHGLYPVPAPATLELLKGAPIYARDIDAELVTPTGAALLTSVARGYGPLPPMVVEAIGYGAGSKDLPIPNLLRLVLGQPAQGPGGGERHGGTAHDQGHDHGHDHGHDYGHDHGHDHGHAPGPGSGLSMLDRDEVAVLEANVDDMVPELWEHVSQLLFGAGALDVFLTPVQMKKNRPGTLITVLGPAGRVEALADVLFAETTTLGVRQSRSARLKLQREHWQVQTPYGPLGVKVGLRSGQVLNLAPEYEECRAAARARGVPLKEVYQAAIAAAWQLRRG